jgi:tRNA-Thr(GGU) m(6)t(6)A37 methyltransferase TsaA
MISEQKEGGFQIRSIGQVVSKGADGYFALRIDEAYRDGLKQLDGFSHVIVIWWADQMDTEKARSILTTQLPYAPDVVCGVFACRSEYRPNPIAITTVPIHSVSVEDGEVVLAWMDAADGSAILDLKPYIPICDRIRDVHVPDWIADWPMWQEEADAYFSEHATDFGE